MAPKTAILVLVLISAVLCGLHFVGAQEVTAANAAGTGNWTSSATSASGDEERSKEAVEVMSEFDRAQADDDLDTSGEVDVGDVDGESDDQEVDQSPTHLLTRILMQRSLRLCWTQQYCKKYFKKPGCCKKKCVNLASDNRNCGNCGRSCNSNKGYHCQSGQCRKTETKILRRSVLSKPTPKLHKGSQGSQAKDHNDKPPHNLSKPAKPSKPSKPSKASKPIKPSKPSKPSKPTKPSKPQQPLPGWQQSKCGGNKKCSKGYTCCNGRCVELQSCNDHCGKCGKGCGTGSMCCKGQCVDVKDDNRNCGECGRSCGYGNRCCNGSCKNIFGNDQHNCGTCGKKCATSCQFGICGYAH